ncbi:hypothetical protein ACH5RR_037362 [Cinchona calisaya]|uniref:Late embryogenesis abundant protein n=1 Tax=Cinchona calisaya TaxID=153742 RepID=A0ABD2Y777_9GENT
MEELSQPSHVNNEDVTIKGDNNLKECERPIQEPVTHIAQEIMQQEGLIILEANGLMDKVSDDNGALVEQNHRVSAPVISNEAQVDFPAFSKPIHISAVYG